GNTKGILKGLSSVTLLELDNT
ncbi:unnamed protein product, partial [Callosobruchus maculatus]